MLAIELRSATGRFVVHHRGRAMSDTRHAPKQEET
jgi:hypothetical protein